MKMLVVITPGGKYRHSLGKGEMPGYLSCFHDRKEG
jgi:hypothetical protein